MKALSENSSGSCAKELERGSAPGKARLFSKATSCSTGLLALGFASAFAGAALYVTLVEQPARLALDDSLMMRKAPSSDRRGFALLGGLALLAAIPEVAAGGQGADRRRLGGNLIALASWPKHRFADRDD